MHCELSRFGGLSWEFRDVHFEGDGVVGMLWGLGLWVGEEEGVTKRVRELERGTENKELGCFHSILF